MAMSANDVMKMIKDKEIKFVDLRFTDTRGKEQHVSVPVKAFTMDKFESGHFFDGSSIAGWKSIEASDMLLMPDPDSARMDPFTDEPVLNITCDCVEPTDGKGYDRDPRTIAKRAEAYLKSSGLGDTAYFGPEPEFFIFDSVTWNVDMSGCFCKIKSEEAPWSSGEEYEGGNMGHRAPIKGGYFPVPPTDTLQDIRNAMVLAMEQQGVECEVHHHEVGAMGQNEIGTKFNSLVKRADWMQILKYTVWNVAHSYGKTATFMPKPVVGDYGSGYQFVQAPGAGVRGTDQPRLLVAQPFRRLPHPARHQPQGAPGRSALSGPDDQFLSRFCGDADGRTGRSAEQDSPWRPDRQKHVRLAAGPGKKDPAGVLVTRNGPGMPQQGPRLSDQGRGVLRRHA